ncbi:hypothetical protein BG004_005232, partial [Podila humilis]
MSLSKPTNIPNLTQTHNEHEEDLTRTNVIISGGGIGGLTLAILLYKANIPFIVLERAHEIKPLGSAISLGAHIGPLFKQLGIYDDFLARSKLHQRARVYSEDLELVQDIPFFWYHE